MVKLPEGWKQVSLGEVLEYEQPTKYIVKTESYDEQHGTPVLTPGKTFILGYTNEKDGIFENTPTIIFDDFTTDSRYITFPFKVKSSALKILKLRNSGNNLYFLYSVMQILNFKPGSEHKRFWISEYSKVKIPLPPLPEQRKIAEILETADKAIEKTDAIIEKYRRIKQGLMQDLLTKGIDEKGQIRSEEAHKFKDSPLGRIPEEWEVVSLGKIGEIKGGKRLPKGEDFSDFETPFPYVRLVNIRNMTIDLRNLLYITENTRRRIQKYTISCNDVMISIAGTIGLIALVPREIDGANLTENAAKITNIQYLDRQFLAYYLTFFKSQDQIAKLVGVVAQPKLALFRIKQIQIPLPPLPEQHRIASVLSQIDEVIEKEERYKEKLERIKQGLMQDLLTGEVRVNHLIKET